MKNIFFVIVLFFTLLFFGNAFAQYQISNSVIGSGGNTTSNSSNVLVSTAGEVFTGISFNTINQNQTGFWYVYQQLTITDVEDEDLLPTVFKLEQNYPNPFNPFTIIKFAVPERSNVLVKIYDILGSAVVTIVNEQLDAGWYEKSFNADGYSSGVYLLRMEAGSYVSIKKMILLR